MLYYICYIIYVILYMLYYIIYIIYFIFDILYFILYMLYYIYYIIYIILYDIIFSARSYLDSQSLLTGKELTIMLPRAILKTLRSKFILRMSNCKWTRNSGERSLIDTILLKRFCLIIINNHRYI